MIEEDAPNTLGALIADLLAIEERVGKAASVVIITSGLPPTWRFAISNAPVVARRYKNGHLEIVPDGDKQLVGDNVALIQIVKE